MKNWVPLNRLASCGAVCAYRRWKCCLCNLTCSC